ncbi:MAG: type II secretion system protein, partial [Cyanobacteria bacterium J06649_5]
LMQSKVDSIDTSFTRPPKSTAGLTLIECLVAIAVMGLTAAAIGPMMIFSVATRVQNQRADQALQLAQGEIDRVRLVVELGGEYKNKLDALPLPSTPSTTTTEVRLVNPPAQFFSTAGSITAPTHARTIDTDSDGDDDYAVQLFRTEGISVGSTPIVFDVGVRVYDARRATPNLGSLKAEPAGLKFTSGEGEGGTRPLAVLYTQIAQGDRDGSLCQHWELLSSAGSVPSGLICD